VSKNVRDALCEKLYERRKHIEKLTDAREFIGNITSDLDREKDFYYERF